MTLLELSGSYFSFWDTLPPQHAWKSLEGGGIVCSIFVQPQKLACCTHGFRVVIGRMEREQNYRWMESMVFGIREGHGLQVSRTHM